MEPIGTLSARRAFQSLTTSVKDVFDPAPSVRQASRPKILPDVFHRVQLWSVGRQKQQGRIVRHFQAARLVPAGAVQHQHTMAPPGSHVAADFFQEDFHDRGIGMRRHNGRSFILLRTNCPENMAGSIALILLRLTQPRSPPPIAAPGCSSDQTKLHPETRFHWQYQLALLPCFNQENGKVF